MEKGESSWEVIALMLVLVVVMVLGVYVAVRAFGAKQAEKVKLPVQQAHVHEGCDHMSNPSSPFYRWPSGSTTEHII